MVATDHARTAKSRRVLKQFFWGRGPRKNCFGCLEFASTCGKLGRRGAPPAGEHVSHWGAVGRVCGEGFCTARGCRHAQGVRSGRRESRVHAAQAGCSLVASGKDQILHETEKLRLLDEI